MTNAEEILDFWLGELTPADWYRADAVLDGRIRHRFLSAWEVLLAGGFRDWLDGAAGALGYIVLADQFPRNMFRGDERAFATDSHARAAARVALDAGWDDATPEPERQFFYLPFMHSEELADQDFSVACFATRMPETGADNLRHAIAHREVIRRFGRFPYRNAAFGRDTGPEEQAFLDAGGYAEALRWPAE